MKNTIQILLLSVLIIFLGLESKSEPIPVPPVAEICIGCHGEMGQSDIPMYPKLANQTATYLTIQLQDFRSQRRADADAQNFMWPLTASLSDADIKELSNFFSSQPPDTSHESSVNPAQIALGKRIYQQGIPERKVVKCMICHGDKGQGLAHIPRLSGQFREYISKQLFFFKSKNRVGNPAMNVEVRAMTEKEINAVSAYVETL
jgi:cytochrome c553